jgi:3-phosphoshikimate 1-carboxyvinyltransferase
VEQSTLQLPAFFFVPGDASSGAFFLCAAAIIPGSEVTADRMLLNPTRTGFIDVLRRMGADIKVEFHNQAPEPWGTVQVRYSPGLTACTIGRGEIPALVDEVPILALVATQARGTSVFEGVGELRVKESDRLAAVASQLGRMAAKISVEGDCLTVEGPTRLASAAELDSFGDHRIAMTLRLAGVIAGCQPEIKGEESVGVSYPGFHEALGALLA